MSCLGGGLCLWGPLQNGSPGTVGLGAGLGGGLGADDLSSGVEIPSNLLISSGCLGLSGLNLTNCACGRGGGGALH